ncbi:MAG TPA: NAD(P)/FAD-dependent oxidoreductase [Polyangiaceae bacterium]|nr:NAD(P)/FAD-dependent oxidoreductase [Polyangiaceae bacterium]
MHLDAGIVGCGTAGAAAALFLSRAGHRVTVYEAVEKPMAVGAGIMIQPTGMYVLARLGLLDGVLARGARVNRLHCVTRGRKPVLDLDYADLHPDAFGLGLHRGVLFEALFNAVAESDAINLRCGLPIESLRRDGAHTYVVGRDGREHGPHDLIVAADGARSQLRDDATLTRRATQYPWGALWFIGDDPDGVFDGVLFQVVEGTHHMFGMLPSGLGPVGDTKRVSLFWSIRADQVNAWRSAGLEPWKYLLRSLEPRCASVTDQIGSVDEVLFARYWDVVLNQWHAPGLVFLGDAAHATSPQLGQGANLALIDAIALADSLARGPLLERALAEYSLGRRHHLNYYQWATRFLTPFFQSDHEALGTLRDVFMGFACRLPYVRTRMLRTMCGLERGVLLPDPLPLPSTPAPG